MLDKIQPLRYPQPLDYSKQGVPVPGTSKPGQTAVYRDRIWAVNHFPDGVLPGQTLPELFNAGLAHGANRPFLGHRPILSERPLVVSKEYVWETYGQVDKRRRAIGSAMDLLFKSGRFPAGGEFETVGIWCINRPEWQIIDLACQAYNKVSVSLYDTLGPDACEYIVHHAEISLIFASWQHIPALLTISPRTPTVKTIVAIDKLEHRPREVFTAWAKERGIEIMDLPEFEALGEQNLIAPLPCGPDTVTTICYTSGTTNNPKGVVLTHRNLASAALSNFHGANYTLDEICFSYLPLAHIYERIVEIMFFALGGKIGYFSGDPLRLLEDAQMLKPTMFVSVPRVLNRIYQAAMQNTKAPGVKGALFRKALETKLHYLHTTGANTHKLYDALVFRKVQAVLGGEVRNIVSGSAPISPEVMDFLKIAFGCNVLEGYGLTETCATLTLGWIGDPTSTGTVGAPQTCSEIKLVDVPSMNYTSKDKPNPRGELCTRGPNVFARYFKDEKNTKDAIDAEGWFHTGDVAEVDEAGRFKIIDRIKNIMKLAQGEYVALEKIENAYTANPLVAQLYVHGDSLRDYLIAVVVPDPAALGGLIGHPADDTRGLSKACGDPKVAEKVLHVLHRTAEKAGLKGFERVKAVHLTMEPFSVDNGLLTPTFKVRRRDAAVFYKEVLEGLYDRTTARV